MITVQSLVNWEVDSELWELMMIHSTDDWKCSIVTEHTCMLSEVLPSYRNISCDFVAKQIYGLIMNNLNYEPKMIVRHIEQTY